MARLGNVYARRLASRTVSARARKSWIRIHSEHKKTRGLRQWLFRLQVGYSPSTCGPGRECFQVWRRFRKRSITLSALSSGTLCMGWLSTVSAQRETGCSDPGTAVRRSRRQPGSFQRLRRCTVRGTLCGTRGRRISVRWDRARSPVLSRIAMTRAPDSAYCWMMCCAMS